MTSRALLDGILGNPQINADFVLDSTQKFGMGNIVPGFDAYWGGGEWMYCYYAGTIRQFGLVSPLPVFDATLQRWRWEVSETANTANLGEQVGVAMVGGVAGNYGWVQIAGLTPINSTANVAAGVTFGITAAGQVGANTAGKQILNAQSAANGATTVAKANCYALNGSTTLQVPNSDGWFIGAYLSGTGIQATTTVIAIDPSGRLVTLSLPVTTLVTGTVTATYNNATVFYNVVAINRPFAQGAIT